MIEVALFVKNTDVAHTPGIPQLSGFQIPFFRLGIVRLSVIEVSLGVIETKIDHRIRQALISSLEIPFLRLGIVGLIVI